MVDIDFEAERNRIVQDAHNGMASNKEAVARLAILAALEARMKGKNW